MFPSAQFRRQHVHFIGICGVAMGPIAKMFADMGWKVTGSDKGFFPPMSDYLKESGIDFYPGFHPERFFDPPQSPPFQGVGDIASPPLQGGDGEGGRYGKPDLVVVGNFIGPSNPEFVYVKEHGIPFKSYPEVVAEHIVKEESIVVAGTYGKSTITAALAWVLEQDGRNPSYMSGGILKNFPDGARATDSDWSVVEGDEYSTSRWDSRPKFVHYKPKYLVLTSTEWDHTDLYATHEDYLQAFRELVAPVPEDGIIVYEPDKVDASIIEEAQCNLVEYRIPTEKVFETTLIGGHNQSNLTAVAVLCDYLGIEESLMQEALESFKGVRRRLEVRYDVDGVKVVDDLAHSPAKARASIRALRDWFPGSRIRIVFEPNIGSRTHEALGLYDGVFDEADEVYIPRLSKAKVGLGRPQWISGAELKEALENQESRIKIQVFYLDNDEELVERLVSESKKGDVIAFMGSHGFRGMIEWVIEHLHE